MAVHRILVAGSLCLVPRNERLRTVSGWEQSSTKRDCPCAVGVPDITIGNQDGMHVFYLIRVLLQIIHIVCNHECNLKCQSIIKGSYIKTCGLLQFLDSVNESVSVYEKLS